MEKTSQIHCPHLGLKNDPTTCFSYPSTGNICYHVKAGRIPSLDHQRSTCLLSQHVDCQVYNNSPGEKMPRQIRQRREPITISAKTLWRLFLIIILVLGGVLGVIYYEFIFSNLERIASPAWQQTQQERPTTAVPSPTVEPTLTATLQPTATITLQPTASPTITREPAVLALDTPIGYEYQFIIIRVKDGESIGQFTVRYNTTEAAIRAVNYDLPSVLFIDRILVIPIDITDASGLPAFQAVEMQEGGISVEALAKQFGVAPEDVYLYNDVQPGRILQAGEWILIPREQP